MGGALRKRCRKGADPSCSGGVSAPGAFPLLTMTGLCPGCCHRFWLIQRPAYRLTLLFLRRLSSGASCRPWDIAGLCDASFCRVLSPAPQQCVIRGSVPACHGPKLCMSRPHLFKLQLFGSALLPPVQAHCLGESTKKPVAERYATG